MTIVSSEEPPVSDPPSPSQGDSRSQSPIGADWKNFTHQPPKIEKNIDQALFDNTQPSLEISALKISRDTILKSNVPTSKIDQTNGTILLDSRSKDISLSKDLLKIKHESVLGRVDAGAEGKVFSFKKAENKTAENEPARSKGRSKSRKNTRNVVKDEKIV